MSSDKEETNDKRKSSQSTESTLSISRSLSPTPSLVAFEAEISRSNGLAVTPTQHPTNSNRSITPPTISPLSKRSPLMNSIEDSEEAKSEEIKYEEAESRSLSPEQNREATPRAEEAPAGIAEDDEYYASDSSLSSADSNNKDIEAADTKTPAGRVPLPENKTFVFEPYFRRPDFIPAPPITGNEAWAKNRVWNDEKKKYEIVDLEKMAKY